MLLTQLNKKCKPRNKPIVKNYIYNRNKSSSHRPAVKFLCKIVNLVIALKLNRIQIILGLCKKAPRNSWPLRIIFPRWTKSNLRRIWASKKLPKDPLTTNQIFLISTYRMCILKAYSKARTPLFRDTPLRQPCLDNNLIRNHKLRLPNRKRMFWIMTTWIVVYPIFAKTYFLVRSWPRSSTGRSRGSGKINWRRNFKGRSRKT